MCLYSWHFVGFFLFRKTSLHAQNCSSILGGQGPLNDLKSVYHMISKAFEVYAKNALVLENKKTFHVN